MNRSPMIPCDPAEGIRSTQVVWAGLLLGCLGYMIVVSMNRGVPPQQVSMAYIGLGLGLLQAAATLFVPTLVAKSQMKQKDFDAIELAEWDRHMCPIYRYKVIVGLAMLEGANFFNLVCYLGESQWWSLALVIFLMLWMVTMFPTLSNFESWAEDRKRNLQNRFDA